MRMGAFFARLFLVILFLPLVGCGGGGQVPKVPTPTPTVITGAGTVTLLSPYVSDDFSARLEEWAAGLHEEAAAIEVEVEIVSDSELNALLETAEQLPDVMLLPAEYLPDLAARDLLDTDMPASAFEEVGGEKFYPIPLAQAKSNNELLAIPYYASVQGIWYRKDLFEAEGLDAPDTAEKILKAAETLHDPAAPVYGIALPAGSEESLVHHALAHLAQGAGAQALAEDGTPQFTDPAFVSTLQLYADLAEFGPPGEITISEARDLFLKEQVAMILDSTSLPQELANQSKSVAIVEEMSRKMGFVAAIRGGQEDGVTYVYTLALAVSKGANRDAAGALVHYLLDDAYNVYWIPQGWAPTLKGFTLQWRALKAHDWFGYYEMGMPEDLLDGLRKAPGWGATGEAAALTASRIYAARLFPAAVEKVLSGEVDVEQAASWLQDEATKLQSERK